MARRLWLLAALAALGCDGSPPVPPDAGEAPDTGAPGVDAGPPPPPPDCAPGAREVREVTEPTALVPADDAWLFAFANPDPYFDDFIAGTMTRPSAGTDARGVTWEALPPVEPGRLGRVREGALYAIAHLRTAEGTRVFARANRLMGVGTRGGLAPGDPYGAGWSRVPVVVEPGDDDVFVRVTPARDDATLELFATTDEVYFDFEDTTAPTPRLGDDSEQWLGVTLLNLEGHPIRDLRARVVASADWEATEVIHPSLPAGAATQVAFRLVPARPVASADAPIPVTLEVESECLGFAYRASTELSPVPADATFRRTFRSAIDGSAQFYGVRPPTAFDAARDYALVLSLHGAGVEARGQVDAYGPRDWAYVVAPTNRRPFGFDWEAWGRLDAIEVLEHASASYHTDPTQVYLTGHSMGGHGTWQVGVHFPGRFALVGPSAGWSSFYSYGGAPRPSGAFARSMASSDTNAYAENLARRAVYVLHGDADDNVPVSEARAMRALVEPLAPDFGYHEQPGAGHWWDASDAPGTDCVDWAPMFARMQAVRLDPTELAFAWRSPGPWVNAEHSFVTVTSALSSDADTVVASALDGADGVAITTTNVRGMILDGAALAARGITRARVDGTDVALTAGPVAWGPQTGKRPDRYGPFGQAMARPWCWVYPDGGPPAYRRHTSWLASYWSILGNGAACALPASAVDDALRAERNLIWLGVPSADTGVDGLPFAWDAEAITAGGEHRDAALAFVYPRGERLDAFVFATAGSEGLLYGIIPFTSRFALPDYLVLGDGGVITAGFFDAEWSS